MTVHFVHIRKTGGTSIKGAIRDAQAAGACSDVTLNKHRFGMTDLQSGDQCFFAVRDPVTRFVSGFYSRLRQGRPRHDRPWTDDEAIVFAHFSTPRQLADELAARTPEAVHAMGAVNHVRHPLRTWLGTPRRFSKNIDKVIYIARQETLNDDWVRLRPLLGIPEHIALPSDDHRAHRTTGVDDTGLDDAGRRAVLEWYAEDVELIALCDEFRRERFSIGT